MIEKLCRQIDSRNAYRNDYESLSRCSSLYFLKHETSNDFDVDILFRLLKSATIFALSEKEEYRKQAYSIAIMARNVMPIISVTEPKKEIEALITIILSRLGNFPAEDKFSKEVSFDVSVLPPMLRLERAYHVLKNQINPCLDQIIKLTDFQRDLWEAMLKHRVVVVNAPTSAGKSYVLQNYVINAILNGRANNILYIVPSRALIEQVIIGFKGLVQEYNVGNSLIRITEVPYNYGDTVEKTIYVLTQERAQLLLETDISIDLVITDEAQNITEGARGVILQSVIEQIIKSKEDVNFIFAMPFVKNPDIFLSVFNLGSDYAVIPTAESPVKQNLYNIVVDTHVTNKVQIEQINDEGNREFLCDIKLETDLTDEDRYLAILSCTFGKNQNNIVFGSEPSKCEKLSSYIMQLLEKKEDEELLAFSAFLKEHIHKDFLLSETIQYGVAYHYGVLPSFIRKEIERLATKGKINYIVCTSTLLQGINLPAQNIFIMKPSKGRIEQRPGDMTPSEFWNLVGRAGRLTKDYEGNVFLINIQEWSRKYIDEKERYQTINSAYASMVNQKKNELVQYISNVEHPSSVAETQGFENTFMKLLDTYLVSGVDNLSGELTQHEDGVDYSDVIEAVENASNRISLPRELLMQNPNVSAFRQQEMYNYMLKRSAEKGITYLIPPHPLQTWGKIEDDSVRLFIRFGKYFKKMPRPRVLAPDARLALRWMRGSSYSELLTDQINYKKKNRKSNKGPDVNTEARELFKKIDSQLRFEYVKFTKCYNDLLAYILMGVNNKDDFPIIPPLHLYLELGACSGTMISLIGIGISRTAAAILAQCSAKTTMDEEETLKWLRNTNLAALNIPDTVINEVNRVIEKI